MTSKIAPRRAVLLIIMDGVGHNPGRINNAVRQARTPNLDSIFSSNALTVLEASGEAVGLPVGQMGNSEVGHTTIGAGKILRQDLVRIDEDIKNGAFFENVALLNAMKKAKDKNRPIHLLGLVSDGGIHSHIRHLIALVNMAKQVGVRPLVHMITDGRDSPRQSSLRFAERLMPHIDAANGAIASVCGRFYAMDRDNRWHRVEKAWRLLVEGQGNRFSNVRDAIEQSWAQDVYDEFIEPFVLEEFEPINSEDEVIFFNFRNDRPRELTEALISEPFNKFDRGDFVSTNVTSMTLYDERFDIPIGFEKDEVEIPLARIISEAGVRQFHVAETEKYPHVTFFFNGGVEQPFEGEERCLIASPTVETYDQQPKMSAPEITSATLTAIKERKYGFIVINYANGDMVGHTGNLEAAIQAVEAVDEGVGLLVEAAKAEDISVIITADHGNCDVMVDPITQSPHTQHTEFPVACAIIDPEAIKLANGQGLSSIAPTVLRLMGLPAPEGMSPQLLLAH